MPLTSPDLPNPLVPGCSPATVAQDDRRGVAPPDQNATATTPFEPLDPDIVSAAIPAFFIGRDVDGFWLARDLKGKNGGIFLFESSALAFIRRNCWPMGCATIFLSERFELDVENQGNPLIAHLKPLMQSATGGWRRMMAFTGGIAEAIDRRSKVF